MKKDTKISVFEVVGSPLCVASNDGQKVYNRLAAAIQDGRSVALSFHNVTTLTSAFLNAAIGVVDTAKQYFKDPRRFDEAIRETMEDSG